jgi:hypothetical protein
MSFSSASPQSSNTFPACNHFLTSVQDNNILLAFLLAAPSEAIKPYISLQASVTSASDTGGQKRKICVTYCIHCCQICTMLPNTLQHFRLQCRCKSNCEVWKIWRGSVHSRCLKSMTQRRGLVRWSRGEGCTHIKQIMEKKYVHCILLCLKISIWDCAGALSAA